MSARKRVSPWTVWHVAVWSSFAALEIRAIRRQDVTLTSWTKEALGRTEQGTPRRGPLVVAFTALLVWFWGHIVLDWGPGLNEEGTVTPWRSTRKP